MAEYPVSKTDAEGNTGEIKKKHRANRQGFEVFASFVFLFCIFKKNT